MRILIAEDESDISHTYQLALESRNHEVVIVDNGIGCLEIYRKELRNGKDPFDAVVLDYKMPGKDGMETAKDILDLNPDQRIIFASAYVEETLAESVKNLRRVVELLQKPFEIQSFIDTVEDKQVYEELKKIFVNLRASDSGDSSSAKPEAGEPPVSREQIRDMFECLRKIQKNRTF